MNSEEVHARTPGSLCITQTLLQDRLIIEVTIVTHGRLCTYLDVYGNLRYSAARHVRDAKKYRNVLNVYDIIVWMQDD